VLKMPDAVGPQVAFGKKVEVDEEDIVPPDPSIEGVVWMPKSKEVRPGLAALTCMPRDRWS
jgi:hypothetical protein